MNDETITQFLKHINSTIDWYNKEASNNKNKWHDEAAAVGIIARAKTIIEITGKNSAYYEQMQRICALDSAESYKAHMLTGVLTALRGDLLDGYLSSFTQLIHGTLFKDFLDMAHHLLGEGYKDGAAVIAGGVLEAHLRQMCTKNNIDIEVLPPNNKPPRPKKASQMNQELGSKIYSLFDQKNITAWLELRNNAAHGKYSEYTEHQVVLFIEGLQDFISRHPA